ncbi:MAG: peptide deformylase [Chloroflexota bacterium]
MAVRKVIQMGNPILREVAAPVVEPSSLATARVIADMRDTLSQTRATTGYGRAIAAPQIGESLRVVFVNVDRPWALVNPTIVWRSPETMVVWDACLSYLCVFFQVERHREIRVRYQDQTGVWHEDRLKDDLSELLQHEIEHLDGVLAIDLVTDPRTFCTREEFEKRHAASSPYART